MPDKVFKRLICVVLLVALVLGTWIIAEYVDGARRIVGIIILSLLLLGELMIIRPWNWRFHWWFPESTLAGRIIIALSIICLLAITSFWAVIPTRVEVHTVTAPPQIIKEIRIETEYRIPPETQKELNVLWEENLALNKKVAGLEKESEFIPVLEPVGFITGDEARRLLKKACPNKRVTAVEFDSADLITPAEFNKVWQQIKLEEDLGRDANYVFRLIGEFKQPGLENIPIGWARTRQDKTFNAVILYDGGPKLFLFEPLDKQSLRKITRDSIIECLILS